MARCSPLPSARGGWGDGNFSCERWHIDEVFVKVNGELHYLWRAVDHDGEVLEFYVSKTRDKTQALKFLKKAMKRYGHPEVIVTDGFSRTAATVFRRD